MGFRIALAVVLTAACSEKPRGQVDASPPTTASAVDPDQSLPANARVALTKHEGTTNADRTILAAQAAVRRNMADDDAWVALGRGWIEKARESNDPRFYVNADACASVVLGKNPDHAAAADVRAVVLSSRHDFAEARSLAERITNRHPDDAGAWGNLSDALVELGRYEEAGDATQKMLALKPDLASYRRVAHLQWLQGDVARAKQTLENATDLDANALVELGMIFWHEGDYDGADARFDKALARTPDFAPALAGKGRVAMARKDFTRAAELFARSWDKNALLETASLLGDAREAAGDAKGAEDARALVVKNRATDPRAYSLFLSTKKDATKAERNEAVEIVSQEHVKRVDIHTEDALAWALYRAGMVEPAKSAMGRARRLHTPDARIVFHEGAIRIAAGDVAKGKELVKKALTMNRAFDWRGAEEARSLVQPSGAR